MWAYTFANKVTVKYLYYYLKNRVDYFRMVGSQMGSMPQISLPITENFEIFLPSENEQERIVNILDKFDELTSNISKGLPAEIELRKKQYEYYRNKLLNFEELKNE
jgi:type I restriction enzyme ecoprrI specificity protein